MISAIKSTASGPFSRFGGIRSGSSVPGTFLFEVIFPKPSATKSFMNCRSSWLYAIGAFDLDIRLKKRLPFGHRETCAPQGGVPAIAMCGAFKGGEDFGAGDFTLTGGNLSASRQA